MDEETLSILTSIRSLQPDTYNEHIRTALVNHLLVRMKREVSKRGKQDTYVHTERYPKNATYLDMFPVYVSLLECEHGYKEVSMEFGLRSVIVTFSM